MITKITDGNGETKYALDYEDFQKVETLRNCIKNWSFHVKGGNMEKHITNFEHYGSAEKAEKAYVDMVKEIDGKATVPTLLNWLYEEYFEKPDFEAGDLIVNKESRIAFYVLSYNRISRKYQTLRVHDVFDNLDEYVSCKGPEIPVLDLDLRDQDTCMKVGEANLYQTVQTVKEIT